VWSKSVDRSQGRNVWNGKGFTPMPAAEPLPAVEYAEGIPPALAAGLVPSRARGVSGTVRRVKYAIENAGEHAIHHIRIDHGYPDSLRVRVG
jgi:hypothetical protein